MNTENLGLGRRRVADSRDLNFPMRAMLPRRIPNITSKYWYDNAYFADQGATSMCVAYSLVHWLADGPVTHKPIPLIQQPELYKAAQLADEWPGEDYDGTSVRAGAGVLKDKGFIDSYYWGFDLDTMVDALLTKGPVVVGTTWLSGMFYPDSKGIIKAEGSPEGGHAYVINGVNTKTRLLRLKNSWSRSWGLNGRAFISFDEFDKLIKDGAEIMLAVEKK